MALVSMLSGVALAVQDYGGYEGGSGGGIVALVMMLIWLAIAVLIIVAFWKVFTKAGEPGWAAIVPIYNLIVLLKIAGKPLWWIVLCIIPLVNLIPGIMVPIAIAEKFGKGIGFAIGLILLPFIFYPILGFGDARYRG